MKCNNWLSSLHHFSLIHLTFSHLRLNNFPSTLLSNTITPNFHASDKFSHNIPHIQYVNVKVPLTDSKAGMRGWGGMGIALHSLDLGARITWVVSTTPRPLYPRERPSTHCTGGWVDPIAVWTCAKNLAPTGIRSRERPARRHIQ
jgi:hypothetical protein